jgi:dTDP-4-amino-4,6-dideoxygalactose transaminase
MAIPLSRPPVDDEIKAAVLRAVESRSYILGPECQAFEMELAAYTGARHAVLTSSATAALWLALRSLAVKPGDEVLVPSLTAFPTVEAICFAGATPVFVDVDDAGTLDANDAAARASARTVGVVPVHLYGHPADLDALRRLCATLGIWLLEDCAQAHGAAWGGRRVGTFGRAGVFSFYPSKNLPVMGDGGAVLTDDDEVAAGCRRLRDHGRVSRDVHAEVGFNLRFNEIQAAAGRVLLGRLDAMNERRRALAARYRSGLGDLPLDLPAEAPAARHVYHLFVVRTERRDELRRFLAARGIATGVHYPVPGHQQPALAHLPAVSLPRTERLVQAVLSLPLSPGHTDAEIDDVVAGVRAFFGAA